jgi:hypothetical protein
MSSIHFMKRLDDALSQVNQIMVMYRTEENHAYWSAINEIIDDSYRLQDRIREDMRIKENEK